ncbi:MAG: hypothetical protein AAGD05_00855, partial [Bacteroidota bacterium]
LLEQFSQFINSNLPMRQVTIRDESMTGELLNELILQVEAETISVETLIKTRVEKEVTTYNEQLPEYFNGLVQPLEAERLLNGYRLKNRRPIDAEKQCYIALDAFQKNGFFVLVDDYQVSDLKEEILVDETTKVSFVRLTPLVGG